jgi:hypothetical protein
VASLDKRVDGNHPHQNETDERRRRHAKCATSSTLRVVKRPFRSIAGAPTRNGVGEHIVVDLVSSARAVLRAGSDNALGSELPQDVCGLLLFDLGITCEIARPMSDL